MSHDAPDNTSRIGALLGKFPPLKEDSALALRLLGGAEDEVILLQKVAKYWNQRAKLDRPDGLVVVTNHRFVFLAMEQESPFVSTEYLLFPYREISNLERIRVMMISPAIRFTARGLSYTFTLLSGAEKVHRHIESAMRNLGLDT